MLASVIYVQNVANKPKQENEFYVMKAHKYYEVSTKSRVEQH